MVRTMTVEEARARPLEELLREVAARQEAVRVSLGEGEEVEIRALPALKPLITVDAVVPEGWKDAIYAGK